MTAEERPPVAGESASDKLRLPVTGEVTSDRRGEAASDRREEAISDRRGRQ